MINQPLKILLSVLIAVSGLIGGCKPMPQKQSTTTTAVGQLPTCVGLGCESQVKAGLQEECVGMGCPTADVK